MCDEYIVELKPFFKRAWKYVHIIYTKRTVHDDNSKCPRALSEMFKNSE